MTKLGQSIKYNGENFIIIGVKPSIFLEEEHQPRWHKFTRYELMIGTQLKDARPGGFWHIKLNETERAEYMKIPFIYIHNINSFIYARLITIAEVDNE